MIAEMISSYDVSSPYILAIPRFIGVSNKELKRIGKFNVWMPFKSIFFLRFPKRVPYMDAHSFYYPQYFERIIVPVIADKRIVVITRAGIIDDLRRNDRLPWRDIEYVETPEQDLLQSYDEVTQSIDAILNNHNREDTVLLFAGGPASKYMVYEYSRKGYQGIDVGRGLETVFTDTSLQHLI